MMENILKGIEGERFPLIGGITEYRVTFSETADRNTIHDHEISWQIYWSNPYSEYEKVPFSGQKKGRLTTYKFLQNLQDKNLQLKATYKSETVELHITPQANGEVKIIDIFFLDVEYKVQDTGNFKYMNSLNLQIYTLNMLGKYVEFKIYDTVNGQDIEVAKSTEPMKIVQKNGIVKTKNSILLSPGMSMMTQQDRSANEHHYKVRVWETNNEENFYEEELRVKNETGQMDFPQDSQTPVKTGTSEPAKEKGDEKKLSCGIEYRSLVRCTRYGREPNAKYGPIYSGSVMIKSFKKWENFISDNKLTRTEYEIICGMSVNEGNLDAVQSYDSEILTFGAMQKTINPEGYGELPIQLWEFKEKYPDDFKELLGNCGWQVKKEGSKYRAYYNDETGIELKNKIRNGFKREKFGENVVCLPIEPFIALGKSEIFQSKQIDDFIIRLRRCLEEVVVEKYHKNNQGFRITDKEYLFKVKDIFLSKLGMATVLDQSVNRPALVRFNVGEAMSRFFRRHPNISRHPKEWGKMHTEYEKEIIEDYGNKREGTDMKLRFLKMKSNKYLNEI